MCVWGGLTVTDVVVGPGRGLALRRLQLLTAGRSTRRIRLTGWSNVDRTSGRGNKIKPEDTHTVPSSAGL